MFSRQLLQKPTHTHMATVAATTESPTLPTLPILPELADERVVCHCLNVTAGDIRLAVEVDEMDSLRAVMSETRAGTGCTSCHSVIRRLLED